MLTNVFKIDTVIIQISVTEYHHFDKPSCLWFILTHQSMGGMRVVKSGHLTISTF